MNSRVDEMRLRLAVLAPVALDIIDESHKRRTCRCARWRRTPKLRIVSAQFAGKIRWRATV